MTILTVNYGKNKQHSICYQKVMISMANNTSVIPVRKILHILSCWHDCSPGGEYTFNRIFTFAFFRSSVNSSFMTAQMSCPNSTVTIFFTLQFLQ